MIESYVIEGMNIYFTITKVFISHEYRRLQHYKSKYYLCMYIFYFFTALHNVITNTIGELISLS